MDPLLQKMKQPWDGAVGWEIRAFETFQQRFWWTMVQMQESVLSYLPAVLSLD